MKKIKFKKKRQLTWKEAVSRFFKGTLVGCYFEYGDGSCSKVITKETKYKEFFDHYNNGGAFYEWC